MAVAGLAVPSIASAEVFPVRSVCIEDHTYGPYYPTAVAQVTNAYTGVQNVAIGYATECGANLQIEVHLVPAADSAGQPCWSGAGATSGGYWSDGVVYVWYNYYRLACRDSGMDESRKWFSRAIGWALGMQTVHTGTEKRVMNLDYPGQVPYPTQADIEVVQTIYRAVARQGLKDTRDQHKGRR